MDGDDNDDDGDGDDDVEDGDHDADDDGDVDDEGARGAGPISDCADGAAGHAALTVIFRKNRANQRLAKQRSGKQCAATQYLGNSGLGANLCLGI